MSNIQPRYSVIAELRACIAELVSKHETMANRLFDAKVPCNSSQWAMVVGMHMGVSVLDKRLRELRTAREKARKALDEAQGRLPPEPASSGELLAALGAVASQRRHALDERDSLRDQLSGQKSLTASMATSAEKAWASLDVAVAKRKAAEDELAALRAKGDDKLKRLREDIVNDMPIHDTTHGPMVITVVSVVAKIDRLIAEHPPKEQR